jgi:hypothetical protein
VTFSGAYLDAAQETKRRGQTRLAITWGHNKDHRPDLKQLLFILTVAKDGGVPVYFQAKSGNVADDRTHRATWDLLCTLTGRRDFLYVADCKLASTANMAYVHGHGGRFLTVLPALGPRTASSARPCPGAGSGGDGFTTGMTIRETSSIGTASASRRQPVWKGIGWSGITARARRNWTPWPARGNWSGP